MDHRDGSFDPEKKGRAEGLAEGEAKGRTNERLAIARNLKNMNLPTADIAKATGLTAEEIDRL